MNKQQQRIVIVLAAVITLTAAVLHGRWTNRWGSPDALAQAAAIVKDFPREFGNWRLVKSEELTANVRGILQCDNYVQAAYENSATGEHVLLTLLLGPPGPMSVHTPEICYTSVDSVPIGKRRSIAPVASRPDDSFWMVQFREVHDADAGITRVYYSWSDGTKWTAVEEPRLTFGGKPYLYKAQLRLSLPEGAEGQEQDSARAFFADFLPAFSRATGNEDTPKAP